MLDKFAKLLGIHRDQADDALRSERVAKHVIGRRSFFGAAAALASGAVFSFGTEPLVDDAVEPTIITKIDALAGVITVSSKLSTPINVGDYIFRTGYSHVAFMNPLDYKQLADRPLFFPVQDRRPLT